MKKILLFSLLMGATGLAAFSQSAAQHPGDVAPAGVAEPDASAPSVTAAADAPCEAPPVNKKTLSGWMDLGRYKRDNSTLAAPAANEKRVVFFGSSTTDNWGRKDGSVFFPGEPYINRGISGETSPQMLLRFEQDVVALKPAAVVFLGGTNDPAGNSGPMTLDMTEANIEAMAAIAKENGIQMILGSQLPVTAFPWNKCVHPGAELLALSAWEKEFAAARHLGYVDYYSALVGDDGNFRPGLSADGVHPTKKGYELMTPVVEDVIQKVLKQQ